MSLNLDSSTPLHPHNKPHTFIRAVWVSQIFWSRTQIGCDLAGLMFVPAFIFWSCPPHPPHPTCLCSPSVICPCDHSQLFIGWHHKGIHPICAAHSYKHKQSSILMIQSSLFLSVRSQWEILHWVLLFCFSYSHADWMFFWENYSGCRSICCCLHYFTSLPLWPAYSIYGSFLSLAHMQC